MIIDFDKIESITVEGFKGGKGELLMQTFADDDCKIMRQVLLPGTSTGLHRHVQNCELVIVVSGEATIHYDGKTEVATTGQIHYCPRGHEHYIENLTDGNLVYFGVVTELRELVSEQGK